jgi:hypothetical protein
MGAQEAALAHTDAEGGETPDSGGVLAEHEAAATRARMGLTQGHGGLMDRVRRVCGWAKLG